MNLYIDGTIENNEKGRLLNIRIDMLLYAYFRLDLIQVEIMKPHQH